MSKCAERSVKSDSYDPKFGIPMVPVDLFVSCCRFRKLFLVDKSSKPAFIAFILKELPEEVNNKSNETSDRSNKLYFIVEDWDCVCPEYWFGANELAVYEDPKPVVADGDCPDEILLEKLPLTFSGREDGGTYPMVMFARPLLLELWPEGMTDVVKSTAEVEKPSTGRERNSTEIFTYIKS